LPTPCTAPLPCRPSRSWRKPGCWQTTPPTPPRGGACTTQRLGGRPAHAPPLACLSVGDWFGTGFAVWRGLASCVPVVALLACNWVCSVGVGRQACRKAGWWHNPCQCVSGRASWCWRALPAPSPDVLVSAPTRNVTDMAVPVAAAAGDYLYQRGKESLQQKAQQLVQEERRVAQAAAVSKVCVCRGVAGAALAERRMHAQNACMSSAAHEQDSVRNAGSRLGDSGLSPEQPRTPA